MPKLKEVIISITDRCNSKCKMCDIPAEKTKELSSSQWKQVIRDASLIGAQTIVFSGGEPLLREDIFELIDFVKDNSMSACITSNGYLIDEGVASKLSQSGVDVVNISIDGPKEVHDYLRGCGAFDKALMALENLRRHKIEPTIATVVLSYNYKYLSYIIDLARQYGATTIKFQPFSRIFLNKRECEDYFLISDKEIKEIKQVIGEVIHLCNRYGIATNPRNYLEMIPFYLGKRPLDYICSTLWTSCPINSQGDIYPCWVITQKDKLIGNIIEDSFSNIWSSERRNSIIEKIKLEGCPGCMMSCYDENFGTEDIRKRIIINVKSFQKKGPYEYIKYKLKRWKTRFRFYVHYRGSLNMIVKRLKGLFRKKRLLKVDLDRKDLEQALKEIAIIKQIFKKEARCCQRK